MVAFYNTRMSQRYTRDQARRFVHGIWGAQQRLVQRLATSLQADAGLDLDDFVLLEHVAHTDLAPGELATTLRLPPHTISRRLGRLETRGLLRRVLDPDDARRRVLRPTAAGSAALQRAYVLLDERLSGALRGLGAERLDALLSDLTTLAASDDASA